MCSVNAIATILAQRIAILYLSCPGVEAVGDSGAGGVNQLFKGGCYRIGSGQSWGAFMP